MSDIINQESYPHQLLQKLFEEMDQASLQEIYQKGKKVKLKAGDYLFKQGDSKNELFIVLSGRLRATNQEKGGAVILGDIAEGEPVGEMALFTKEPRMASVVAIRNSSVLEIGKEQYKDIVQKHPDFAAALTNFIIKRLRRNVLQQHVEAAPKNIAIIPLQNDLDLSYWVDAIQENLSNSYGSVNSFYMPLAGEKSFGSAFEAIENHAGINILIADQTNSEWTKHCLAYADLVIVASNFYADPKLYEIEKQHHLYEKHILNKKTYLLLLHQNENKTPTGTSTWFQDRAFHLHIHARKSNQKDLNRLCRIITNQAVGLILGGTGVKGYAHVGAVKALLESGVEIDFVGGSSAGALYGISMAYADFDFGKIDEICENASEKELSVNDYFLSVFSSTSEKNISGFMKSIFGKTNLEDLWINSYCVSATVSNSEVKVHRHGPVWQHVQASFSLPGIFPPVVIGDQLHIDAGTSDGLPVDPMYQFPVKHIIAISLSGTEPQNVNNKDIPSIWKQIKGTFSKTKKFDDPVVTSVLLNSMTFKSVQKEEITKSKVSLYFDINLRAVSMLDDSKWKKVIKKGHDQIKSYLDELDDENRFWKG